MKPRGWMIWPMAAVYAGLLTSPKDPGDWLLYTIGATIALVPPVFLGYLVGCQRVGR